MAFLHEFEVGPIYFILFIVGKQFTMKYTSDKYIVQKPIESPLMKMAFKTEQLNK